MYLFLKKSKTNTNMHTELNLVIEVIRKIDLIVTLVITNFQPLYTLNTLSDKSMPKQNAQIHVR